MRFLVSIVYTYFFMSLLFGCKNANKNKTEDKFYTNKSSSWDASRIPLIKPYEMIKLNGINEWDMNLVEVPGSVSNIKEINVIQNTIAIHAGETYCNNTKVQEAWFVIIPEKHIEKGFEKKEDFDKYFSSLQINEPKLYNVDKISADYNKSRKIDWQKGFD